ncbi:MAG: hypothetical protein BAJALOKI1v1_2420009 [Promethearchaeota archaeon]|nr:MAG: hypothetical protein BAJALOKI1v1_2420009 [Candidatus Lokiarchaeota archaeon]
MDTSFFNIINENTSLVKRVAEINDNFKFWFHDLSKDYRSLG